MSGNLFWLSDEQWERISGTLLPACARVPPPHELLEQPFVCLPGCRRWVLLWKRNRAGNCRLIAIACGFLNLHRPRILSCPPESLRYVFIGWSQSTISNV
jgi:hypothetical protein